MKYFTPPTRPPADQSQLTADSVIAARATNELRSSQFAAGSPAARAGLTLGKRPRATLLTGGCIEGGREACEELYGTNGLFHDGTHFARNNAKSDVIVTGGAANITWDRCPGLRLIVAGGYCSADQVRTGPPVSSCVVRHAPHEERTVVLCLNSEPFSGDALNVRIPWRWLHFQLVGLYFWMRRHTAHRPIKRSTQKIIRLNSAS